MEGKHQDQHSSCRGRGGERMRRVLGVVAAFACAVLVPASSASAAGTMFAWGQNDSGALCNGSHGVNNSTPTATTITNATAVTGGLDWSLALLSNGEVMGCGDNGGGQLGDNSTTERDSPVTTQNPANTGPLTNVKQLAAGWSFTDALLTDGTVVGWGSNAGGTGITTGCSTTELPCAVENTANTGPLTGVSSIAATMFHALAVLSNGQVVAWGGNRGGQLGTGATNDGTGSGPPVQVQNPANTGPLTGATAAAAGGDQAFGCGGCNEHSLVLLNDGTVDGFGYNGSGQVGVPTATCNPCDLPQPISGLSGVTQIAAGRGGNVSDNSGFSMALLSDGSVKTWGVNSTGELGLGTHDSNVHSTPTLVPGLSCIVGISGTYNAAFALRSDGTLFGWGGQTPLFSDGMEHDSPVPIALTNVDAIALGPSAKAMLAIRGSGPPGGGGPGCSGSGSPPGPVIGGLDLDGYCRSLGFAHSQLNGSQWDCVSSTGGRSAINLQDACNYQYPTQESLAFERNPSDANTWVCVAVSNGRLGLAAPYAPSNGVSLAANRVQRLPDGLSAVAVQTQGSCQLKLSEAAIKAAGDQASVARKHKKHKKHKKGLIKTSTITAAGSGLHLIPIKLTNKGKKLVKKLHKHKKHAALSAAANNDPVKVTCTPVTYPTVRGNGSTAAPNTSGKPTPSGSPGSTNTTVPMQTVQPPKSIFPPGKTIVYSGVDSLGDAIAFNVKDGVITPTTPSLNSLRLRCTKPGGTGLIVVTTQPALNYDPLFNGGNISSGGFTRTLSGVNRPAETTTFAASLTATGGFVNLVEQIDPVAPLLLIANPPPGAPIPETAGAACNNAPGAGQFTVKAVGG